jgi:methylated-DNA-[protein]-cysteine S-methyltransferase
MTVSRIPDVDMGVRNPPARPVARRQNDGMTQTHTFQLARIATPIGQMLIALDDQERLRVLDWESHAERMERLMDRHYGPGAVTLKNGEGRGPVVERLKAYIEGEIAAIDGLPVETAGTPFQREVWAALREIPAGQTWSYGQLAAHIGRPAAVRAVGLANGANPVGVVVPCHRVIGADGTLTGYGGGLERKQWLLKHEGARFRETEALLL